MTEEVEKTITAGEDETPKGSETKTYTQEEIDTIISKRLAKQKAAFDRELEEKARKDSEARELEKLQGEERLKKEFEQRERALTEERDRARRDLSISKVRVELSRLGYGDVGDIAPTLVGDDEEETTANISAFDKMIQKMVADKVNQNLHRGAPPVPQGTSGSSLRDEMRRAVGLK